MDTLRQMPAWAWMLVGLLAAVGVLAWYRWMDDQPDDASWLDDDQPPLQASAMPELLPVRARQRLYPPSLRLFEDSHVGDV